MNYLDNLGGAENVESADEAFNYLGFILQSIGIEESARKASPPDFWMVFLGILLDTINMTMEIPEERRLELHQLLREWASKSSATLK